MKMEKIVDENNFKTETRDKIIDLLYEEKELPITIIASKLKLDFYFISDLLENMKFENRVIKREKGNMSFWKLPEGIPIDDLKKKIIYKELFKNSFPEEK